MLQSEGTELARRRSLYRADRAQSVQPRLLSINDACRYAAVSRSEFYKTWLPQLRSILAGKRRLIDRESLDRLIDEILGA
jgi:hypothetical protein